MKRESVWYNILLMVSMKVSTQHPCSHFCYSLPSPLSLLSDFFSFLFSSLSSLLLSHFCFERVCSVLKGREQRLRLECEILINKFFMIQLSSSIRREREREKYQVREGRKHQKGEGARREREKVSDEEGRGPKIFCSWNVMLSSFIIIHPHLIHES